MATRHVSYQFEWGFATYDRDTDQEQISDIEQKGDYINKFDVDIPQSELIADGATIDIIGNELSIHLEGEL
jgi:hypothetical protein